jgi:hypothetical protein
MDTQAVEQFIERLPGDPELRAKYNADPEGTLRELGIDLTDAEVDLVHGTDWTAVPDEALAARISMRAAHGYET